MNYKLKNLSKLKGGSSMNRRDDELLSENGCVRGVVFLSKCPISSPCYDDKVHLCYNKDGSIPFNILQPKILSKDELSNLALISLQKNLINKKICRQGYKYCSNGIQMGNCIKTEENCNQEVVGDNKYLSDFSRHLLNLEISKLTNDNFNYREQIENEFILKYKLPNDELQETFSLVQIDINRLKEYMGTSDYDAGAHNKIYNPNNIELLGWLLAGLHDQEEHSYLEGGTKTSINTSFIKYYFTNPNSYIKVPIIATTDSHNLFNIVDGRHRLGFYNYFNINGYVLTDSKGLDILDQEQIRIDHINLVSKEVNYFNKNIFNNIQNILDQNLRMQPKKSKIIKKCKICYGDHPTFHHNRFTN